ncbi:Nuclear hormone receptor family member nhr-52 [Caenorhabditis elegans]|uniref:Nuclear hormone receptor family member nhr-52 n=1 Tax=Caenorhabditis elegans TaxID=6239 RepID=NHR52_CAEEL|nr:Nuclear hormone receptor family member nhr-52 [Caenorhabditis elegans]O17928.1 RecName: Full=Nuclear hormone receptor family member nhr-52 [Caenorhabditis elegans]AAG15146.1 nuclear receptor NHR-52 [Caenorhabditis elegans]CAB05761.1 Nuclear hormone receptor family member nhr-52 [Caenorhabditis elegans]|eukprot:NP_506899.1 Nuclear hormone receptor family member nhr-52 [Caenorhabditis elegans]
MKCLVCCSYASSRNFGALSCSACKMFFTRATKNYAKFTCKYDKKCFESFTILPKCQFCRFKKCLEIGMRFSEPKQQLFNLNNSVDQDLIILLGNLAVKDGVHYSNFLNFYSLEDPSMDDILADRSRMKLMKRTLEIKTKSHEWTFLGSYYKIAQFLDFDFVKTMSLADRKILFSYNTLRMGSLSRSMRTYLDKRDCLMTPSGDDLFSPAVRGLFDKTPEIINRILCQVVGRLMEIKITYEEYLLLIMIVFCNPSISHELSDSARETLSKYQNMYASFLFRFCQLKNQHKAPTRFNDILSICNVNNKNVEDYCFVHMMFQCMVPEFKFKKLVNDIIIRS